MKNKSIKCEALKECTISSSTDNKFETPIRKGVFTIAYARGLTSVESEENSEIISQALNVTEECGLKPEELLEQRNTLLEIVREFKANYSLNHDMYQRVSKVINASQLLEH